ncbi:glutathione S-transferase 1-like isoform X1 [Branchiostoma lanceolatum]|uniref:glutathione S-transferase 1-like isoform X1 n=1 Tax=Branchiostoma lanceolatum TaxID=7740 RepID=UPI0034545973
MPNYKLIYFEARGRAEPARLLFAAGGLQYDDVRLTREQWKELKPKTPMGQLPILEVDGTEICQSKAIARLIAKEVGMAGKTPLEQARADMIADTVDELAAPCQTFYTLADRNKAEVLKKEFVEKTLPRAVALFEKFASAEGYFVGNSLTWADVTFFAFMDWVITAIPGDHLKGCENLKKVMDNVSSNQGIVKYLKERPETPY